MQNILETLKKEGKKKIEKLKEKLSSIRTGRVSPALAEGIIITAYGGQTRLRLMEFATITVEGPRTLIVIPFDPNVIQDIEKGILESSLNINPKVQGGRIILPFPPLTEEQRKRNTKLLSQIVEETRVEVRKERDLARKKTKEIFENKEISEDQKFFTEKEIDKIAKELDEEIKNIKERKEKEILNI